MFHLVNSGLQSQKKILAVLFGDSYIFKTVGEYEFLKVYL